ncbi:MAG TPA: 2-succinyl-5-enolpyruvyl-6-hydroxy-3-cyclohexene-1-carboxylic-acid synthase [Actinomycetes bacterium]
MSDPGREFALTLVDELARGGLRDACLAPGSRSTPLALAFAEHPRVRLHVHLDERAAAFFALGAAKRSGRPAAVLCTSGTAAANFHPAVLEAHHGRAPLVVLTADRPPELRDTGANQTADQLKLYGATVRWFCEVGLPAAGPGAGPYWRSLGARAVAAATGPPAGPVHLNVAFAEPLVPREPGAAAPGRQGGAPWTASVALPRPPDSAEVAELAARVREAPRGLLVAGWGASLAPAAVDAFAAASGWPVLADPLSGARRGPHAVSTYDALLRAPGFADAHRPDLVLRVGAAPTSKVLTGWLDATVPQVLVDPDGAWPDPGRGAAVRLVADPSALLAAVAEELRGSGGLKSEAGTQAAGGLAGPSGSPPVNRRDADGEAPWRDGWRRAERVAREAIDRLVDGWDEPFEGRVARDVVAALPDGATLVVGSSMPVRDVDAFARPRDGLAFVANRGVSGIDGFVATALGVVAAAGGPVAALCGDLTFLHDASSVLGAGRRPEAVVFVVCDNDGGGIFSFLPQAGLPAARFEELFGTPHGLDLAGLAAVAGLEAQRVTRAAELVPALDKALGAGRSSVLLVPGERPGNAARHREALDAVAAALRAEA